MRSGTDNNDRPVATPETHVPPQNLEAEASVLGAMMVSEGAIAPVILDVRLHDEDFYRERHRIVFRAVTGLYEQGEPVDALTVSEFLAQRGELAAGATMATPVQIRDLAERNVLPAAAVTVLTALWSRAGTASSEIAGLLETAVEVVTACLDGGEHQLAA